MESPEGITCPPLVAAVRTAIAIARQDDAIRAGKNAADKEEIHQLSRGKNGGRGGI